MYNISSGQSTLVSNDENAVEPHWLEDRILYLKLCRFGAVSFIVTDPDDLGNSYVAAQLPARISDLKLRTLAPGKVALLAAGRSTPDGALHNPDCTPKEHHTAKLYDSLMVRHWDSYLSKDRNALFYGILELATPHHGQRSGHYSLSGLHNVLKGTELESPISPFPGAQHYDLSKDGILFVAKDPQVNPANNTRCHLYYSHVPDFSARPSRLHKIEVMNLDGAATGPVFSPDGTSAVYLKMKTNGYEADKNRVIIVADVKDPSSAVETLQGANGDGLWDRSPSSILWSNDARTLYLSAEDEGRTLLFKMPLPSFPTASHNFQSIPQRLTSTGAVIAVYNLGTTSPSLLVSGTSFVDSSTYSIYNPRTSGLELEVISSFTRNGSAVGLSSGQISSIRFPGSRLNTTVHAWVVRPSYFSSSEKYPLAYMVHGGPQGAWLDEWSTRWNPAVFAEQGYVVVLPNPTGSTSYGQAFCDAITEDWGGSPYEDLVNGLEHIEKHMPFVDTSRAVALGASYGGYMMNWINGHPLGRRFKALVVHDGVFSTANLMSSDEQYFPIHDFGGPYWEVSEKWARWDPARWTKHWETPTLVIHNSKDYRLPISEGLATFNILQMRGVESRFLTFPDENHWVLGEENSRVWHRVVLGWVNKFVGLPEPESEEIPSRR